MSSLLKNVSAFLLSLTLLFSQIAFADESLTERTKPISGKVEGVKPNPESKEAIISTFHVVGVDSWDVLYIRRGAGKKFKAKGSIPYNGKGVIIRGSNQNLRPFRWVAIEYKGVKGWVYSRYLELSTQ